MRITIELPAEVENRVIAVAKAEGTSAAAILAQLAVNVFGSSAGDAGIDPQDMAAIREGIADADAGRTIDLEDYIAAVEARDAAAVTPGQNKAA